MAVTLKRFTTCILALVLSACSLAGIGQMDAGGRGGAGWTIEGGAVVRRTLLPPDTPAVMLVRRTTALPATPTRIPTLIPTPTTTPTFPPVAMVLPLDSGAPEPTATAERRMVGSLCSPLEFVELNDLPRVMSDGYHPPLRYYWDARHPAVDFAYYHWKGGGPIAGTGVMAVMEGKVTVALADTFPFGAVVIVETPGENLREDLRTEFGVEEGKSLYSLYAHMDETSPVVRLGETVSACQRLGSVGKSGNSNAAHLHFETRVGPAGAQFAEFSYYREGDSDEARANYRLWATSGKFTHFDPMRLLLYSFEEEQTPAPAPAL